jgi:hypothetical protein
LTDAQSKLQSTTALSFTVQVAAGSELLTGANDSNASGMSRTAPEGTAIQVSAQASGGAGAGRVLLYGYYETPA